MSDIRRLKEQLHHVAMDAAEACAAALDWLAGPLPGEPVVLSTQTANVGSMRLAAKLGFTEVKLFEAWDVEQWLGMWSPVTPSS
jgi:RimJ/RimL family protein N-acetyltransferase